MHTDPTFNPHQHQHQHQQHSFTLYPPLSIPTQSAYTKRNVCVFHAQGRCTKGAACRFSHDDANPFSLFNAADYFPSLYPPTNVPNGQGVDPRVQNRSFKELQHRTRLCSFYLAGKCNRGDRCTFLHDPAALEAGVTAEDLERGRTGRPDGWTKLNVTCKFWLSGRCRKEDSCPFRHEEPELELEQVLPKPDRSRPRSLSLVQLESLILKDGSSLLSPVTRRFRSGSETSEEPEGEESPSPPALSSGTSETGEDVPVPDTPGSEDMPSEIGLDSEKHIRGMRFKSVSEGERRTVTRTFLTDRGGEATTILGAGLLVHRVMLPTDACSVPASKMHHPTLLVSFSAPTRTAYTTYSSARVAQKEAHRLDGRVVRGRKLVAKSNTFGGNFAATVSGLPADATKEELQKLTKASSVSLGDPTFDASEAVEMLHNMLSGFGPLDSFDLLPTLPTENKILIYARCQNASATDAVVKDLHAKSVEFLGNSLLSVEQVYTVKYTVIPREWTGLKTELEKIEKDLDDNLRLRTPLSAEEPIWLQGSSRKELVKAKKLIDNLLIGKRLTLRNTPSMRNWSVYLGKELMATVEKETGTFIQFDERSNTITVYGAEETALLAREKLQVALASQGGTTASTPAPIFMTRSEISPSDQCDICSCPVTDTILRASTCGHTFCYDCIRDYILDAALPLNCPATACAGMLPLSLIRLAVPDETEFDALLESAFLTHIRSHQEFAWCPTPNCWTIYRSGSGSEGDVLQCPNCQTRICPACKLEMHDGFDCQEHRGTVDEQGAM
ncbi:hypothetical protein DACRYDRAFT_24167 [Dacryopinax primogenitus]|uniref:RBR-type E3 ubiquitin transferase n=1 Tax=Dacryopinax primogenitus (strain DJM 731) TaxID=1858805 RepID=M5FZY2_DACPD|nr:uncharacterized protein DACRYDRAFT_24167 [Dacryopinax primogenitus]EJT99116.1 hypothetical protein DACRYDRAFT_24167 [Dacryopinax primogenitus]